MPSLTAYQELLVDFTPRPVHNDRAYRRAMRQIERLLEKCKLSRAERQLLDLLATLVEQYESIEHPVPKVSQRDLWPI